MMIWKNDMGSPFMEIRRACCAQKGAPIRVKKGGKRNRELKGSEWKQTVTATATTTTEKGASR